MTTPSPEIGVQMYSVREIFDADPAGTLEKLAAIGFEVVEPFGYVDRAAQLARLHADAGVRALTGHAPLIGGFTQSDGTPIAVPEWDETFAASAELGIETVIDPFTPAELWRDAAAVEALAERFSKAAERAASFGLRVALHNHDQEFLARIGDESALEYFSRSVDPAVLFELDLYWATAAGADVVLLAGALGPRLVATHVKDGSMTPAPRTPETPVGQTPAGQGEVPLAAGLEAMTSLRLAVVEFDAYDGDILDGVAQSRAWLSRQLAAER